MKENNQESREKVKWVKRNPALHTQLEDAHAMGKVEGKRELIKFLTEECAFRAEFLEWLIIEKFNSNHERE